MPQASEGTAMKRDRLLLHVEDVVFAIGAAALLLGVPAAILLLGFGG